MRAESPRSESPKDNPEPHPEEPCSEYQIDIDRWEDDGGAIRTLDIEKGVAA